MLRRLLLWMGYVPTWFTREDFVFKVGRPPCARCEHANAHERVLIVCDGCLGEWFDAVLE